MKELSASNLMNSSNPILHRISQYLHFEAFLMKCLLYRYINTWTHNKTLKIISNVQTGHIIGPYAGIV